MRKEYIKNPLFFTGSKKDLRFFSAQQHNLGTKRHLPDLPAVILRLPELFSYIGIKTDRRMSTFCHVHGLLHRLHSGTAEHRRDPCQMQDLRRANISFIQIFRLHPAGRGPAAVIENLSFPVYP